MISIALIEDNIEYRLALSNILKRNKNIKIIRELPDCSEMIPYFQVDQPDLVIMDIDLPGISGLEAAWQLRQWWPEMKLLMLTVFEDEEKIFEAIKAGANGYLLKKDSPDRIMDAIFSLQKGEAIMNGIIAAKVMDYFKQLADATPKLDVYHLTEREKDILTRLMEGLGYKQIAAHCGIAKETLNTHVKSIYRKLNVHSRAEAAARFGARIKK